MGNILNNTFLALQGGISGAPAAVLSVARLYYKLMLFCQKNKQTPQQKRQI